MGEETKPDDFIREVSDIAFAKNDKHQLLCRIGYHTWRCWGSVLDAGGGAWKIQKRFCFYCNKEDVRRRRGI